MQEYLESERLYCMTSNGNFVVSLTVQSYCHPPSIRADASPLLGGVTHRQTFQLFADGDNYDEASLEMRFVSVILAGVVCNP
jgi:hypothetical protein